MNNHRVRYIRQFLDELISGVPNSGTSSISPEFKMEDGMDKETYLQHERKIFSEISEKYKLWKGWRIEASESTYPNFSGAEVMVINSGGDLVYEWAYALDSNDLLKGSGGLSQTVSKMQHSDFKWTRALAVSSKIPIVSIIPLFPCSWQKRTSISDDGLFWNFCFLPENDHGNTFWGEFRIRYADNKIEKKAVWLRGLDRPHFINPNLSIVADEGNTILTHNANLPWSMDIKFADGESKYIEFPHWKRIKFNKEVVWACLTDSLDHDWIISTRPINYLDF